MIDYAMNIKEYCKCKFLTQAMLSYIFECISISLPRLEIGVFKPNTAIKMEVACFFLEDEMKTAE